MTDVWGPLNAALDHTAESGRMIDVWLRDDDAVSATPALMRLTECCERHEVPVLLAVIPAHADETLQRVVDAHPILTPTQHGFAHANHAAPGERAREMGGIRPLTATLDDLTEGRDRLGRMFGRSVTNILVPPWNRIDDALLPMLPGLGFSALSAFGPAGRTMPDLLEVNCDLDIINWRGGGVCHPLDKLIGRLAPLLHEAVALDRPIGLLTHHLAHDEACWAFLEACLSRLARHPAVRFTEADIILSRTAAARAWDDMSIAP